MHIRFRHQRIEIIEVRDPREPRDRDLDRGIAWRGALVQSQDVLGRQKAGSIEPRHDAVAAHAGTLCDDRVRVLEQRRIAAELVDQIALETRPLGRLEQRVRADQRRDHAALVDVADQHDRQIGRLGKAHVGDVVRAQVDLRRAAGTLGQDQIRIAAQLLEALQHVGHQIGLEPGIVARRSRRENAPLNNHLRADFGLRLEQHGVHMRRRRYPARARLQRLGAPDLAAIRSHGGVVAHVLRLERPDPQGLPRECPTQPRDQQRFPDIRAGALQHQRGRPEHHSPRLLKGRRYTRSDYPVPRAPVSAPSPAAARPGCLRGRAIGG